MINPEQFLNTLLARNIDFFAGVPDSLLKDLCAYITETIPNKQHIISANEGGAVGLAVGYYLSTGKIPAVYMQNSGLGNTINPLLSIADSKVYSIPILLIIGWRGEAGKKDEPQHAKQGEVTLPLLKAMDIPFEILSDELNQAENQIENAVEYMKKHSSPYALIIRKGTFSEYRIDQGNANNYRYKMKREEVLSVILQNIDPVGIIISTTGKTSREIFELREKNGQSHDFDFLNIGGMGHSSQIALSIALQHPNKNVFCIDGDGAALMHLGSLAINASIKPENFYHIVLNNGSHESVGGQPTVGYDIDFTQIAKGCGYKKAVKVENESELSSVLESLNLNNCPFLLEIRIKPGSREDLGRPLSTPLERKQGFINNIR